MNRVLVSVHHTHGHSGVVIGDGGVLLVRNLRASAAGWEAVQGDRPGVLTWPGDHLVAGGLLLGGAAGAELVVHGPLHDRPRAEISALAARTVDAAITGVLAGR